MRGGLCKRRIKDATHINRLTDIVKGIEMLHKQSKKLRKMLDYRNGDTETGLKFHWSSMGGGWTEVITAPLRKLYQQTKRKRLA